MQAAAILRAKVLHCLRIRFGTAVSEGLLHQIQAQTDLDVLGRWLDQALEAPSLEQFRASLPSQTNGTA